MPEWFGTAVHLTLSLLFVVEVYNALASERPAVHQRWVIAILLMVLIYNLQMLHETTLIMAENVQWIVEFIRGTCG